MWGYRTIMVSDGNADQTDALHNHTLGKFLVTFLAMQSTDDLIAKLENGSGGPRRPPSKADCDPVKTGGYMREVDEGLPPPVPRSVGRCASR